MDSPLYVVGDVHGYRTELTDALRTAGLIDGAERWTGGRARVWFLGDYTDRGPDGVGVLDLVMRLAGEAAAAGGLVDGLLGNHDVLLLAVRRFGAAAVPGRPEPRGFLDVWRRNGGHDGDLARLTASHARWLAARPAAVLADDHLLLHSDTARYLELGTTIAAINAAVLAELASDDPTTVSDCFWRFTDRGAFVNGGRQAAGLLATLGGRRIVHGHSTIPEAFGVPSGDVTAPHAYAGGLVLAVDGGGYLGGPLLVTRLTTS